MAPTNSLILPTISEEELSSFQDVIDPIKEKLILFIKGKKDEPEIAAIEKIIENDLSNPEHISQLYDAVGSLATKYPELQEILKDFAKLPFFQELEAVGDAVAREYDELDDEDEEIKRKKQEALNQGGGSQNVSHYHSRNFEEPDLSKIAAIFAKMSATLAISLAVPGAGFLLAALFLYATRNIANGKEVNHISSRYDDNSDELMNKFLAANNALKTHTGKKAHEAAKDMQEDIAPHEKTLVNEESRLKKTDDKSTKSLSRTKAIIDKAENEQESTNQDKSK